MLSDTMYESFHNPALALCCVNERSVIRFFVILSLLVRLSEDVAGSPYDKESMAIIHLNNTTVMYLKEVTKFLALVCFLREESFERKGEHSNSAKYFYSLIFIYFGESDYLANILFSMISQEQVADCL